MYGDPRGVIGGLLYEAESIFNVIFEIYAVFTCYLTYYKPIGKKKLVWRGQGRARAPARPQNRFSTSFLNSAPFLPVI